MKIYIEDRGKRYEVVRCGESCTFCQYDSPEEYCAKRCYVPCRFYDAVRRIVENGTGLMEVAK